MSNTISQVSNTISLERFAWDKNRKTLTIPFKSIKPQDWYDPSTLMIKSHTTGKEFPFRWFGSSDHFMPNLERPNDREYWILRPREDIVDCPIRKVYLVQNLDEYTIFEGIEND